MAGESPIHTDSRQTFLTTRSYFLRALGIVYLVAFASLWVQVDGLIGSGGILPARVLMAAERAQHPSTLGGFFSLPTLGWISTTDGFLRFLCGSGVVLACVLIYGLFPAPVLFLLWLLYLSLTNLGQVFLPFQWDSLLLETGFLAIFLSPLSVRLVPARRDLRSAYGPVLFLLRWLLFRLMFSSGLFKLTSGDPTWRGLTAMRFHYQTQPIPAWTSWYAHLLPDWFQAVSVVGVLFIEIVVPPFFFGPRRLRLAAFALTVLLQVLIAATGNFGFFNLLTVVLCLTLLDDEALSRVRPGFRTAATRVREFPKPLGVVLAVILVPLPIVPMLYRLDAPGLVPDPLRTAYFVSERFYLTNSYGLFTVMTTQRPELIVEGSRDGVHWRAYGFKWKPTDVRRRPEFCSPHMPRLDWQMWFAALELEDGSPADEWVWNFLLRLKQGSPPVLKLLSYNPFPDRPPENVRVRVEDYRFTTRAERKSSGDWWVATPSPARGIELGPDPQ